MSPSSAIRASGLSVLAALNGEALSLGTGANVIALVQGTINRTAAIGKEVLAQIGGKDAAIDFDALSLSSIEIARSCRQPVAGQWFLDSMNVRHRVRFVVPTDTSWVCYCTPANKV